LVVLSSPPSSPLSPSYPPFACLSLAFGLMDCRRERKDDKKDRGPGEPPLFLFFSPRLRSVPPILPPLIAVDELWISKELDLVGLPNTFLLLLFSLPPFSLFSPGPILLVIFSFSRAEPPVPSVLIVTIACQRSKLCFFFPSPLLSPPPLSSPLLSPSGFFPSHRAQPWRDELAENRPNSQTASPSLSSFFFFSPFLSFPPLAQLRRGSPFFL